MGASKNLLVLNLKSKVRTILIDLGKREWKAVGLFTCQQFAKYSCSTGGCISAVIPPSVSKAESPLNVFVFYHLKQFKLGRRYTLCALYKNFESTFALYISHITLWCFHLTEKTLSYKLTFVSNCNKVFIMSGTKVKVWKISLVFNIKWSLWHCLLLIILYDCFRCIALFLSFLYF